METPYCSGLPSSEVVLFKPLFFMCDYFQFHVTIIVYIYSDRIVLCMKMNGNKGKMLI